MRACAKSFILAILFAMTAFSMESGLKYTEGIFSQPEIDTFLQETGYDKVQNLPEPQLKEIPAYEKNNSPRFPVIPIFSGQTKILRIEKAGYALVPEIKPIGAALVVRGAGFVGVGNFVENQNEQIEYFLRSLLDQDTEIIEAIIYAPYWTNVAADISQALLAKKIPLSAARKLPLFASRNGNKLQIKTVSGMLGQYAILSSEALIKVLESKLNSINKLAVDLGEGKLINLEYPNEIAGQKVEALPFRCLGAQVALQLLDKKKNQQLTKNEEDFVAKSSVNMWLFF